MFALLGGEQDVPQPADLSDTIRDYFAQPAKLQRLADIFGVDVYADPLGCGYYGCAYETEGPYVIKVTADSDEGPMWERLRLLQQQGAIEGGLPKIVRVVALTLTDRPWSARIPRAYATLREDVAPLANKFRARQFLGILGEYAAESASEPPDEQRLFELADAVSEYSPETRELGDLLYRLAELGIPPHDLHEGNLGQRSDAQFGEPGQVLFIDPGTTFVEQTIGERFAANPWPKKVAEAFGRPSPEEVDMSQRRFPEPPRPRQPRPEPPQAGKLLRRIVEEYEATEQPFDPEVPPEQYARPHHFAVNAKGTFVRLGDGRDVFVPDIKIARDPNREYTYAPSHGYAHTLVVFDEGHKAIGWGDVRELTGHQTVRAWMEDVNAYAVGGRKPTFDMNAGERYAVWFDDPEVGHHFVSGNGQVFYDLEEAKSWAVQKAQDMNSRSVRSYVVITLRPDENAALYSEANRKLRGPKLFEEVKRRIVFEVKVPEASHEAWDEWAKQPHHYDDYIDNASSKFWRVTWLALNEHEKQIRHQSTIDAPSREAAILEAKEQSRRDGDKYVKDFHAEEEPSARYTARHTSLFVQNHEVQDTVPWSLNKDEEKALDFIAARYVSGEMLQQGYDPDAGTMDIQYAQAAFVATPADGGNVGTVPLAGGTLAKKIADLWEMEPVHAWDYQLEAERFAAEGGEDPYGFLMAMNPNRSCPVGTSVQTLIFEKAAFNKTSAKRWAKDQGFKSSKVDETKESYRLRQEDPRRFTKGGFRTIEMAGGVKAVIGCPK
jgi:hypothetical protein